MVFTEATNEVIGLVDQEDWLSGQLLILGAQIVSLHMQHKSGLDVIPGIQDPTSILLGWMGIVRGLDGQRFVSSFNCG